MMQISGPIDEIKLERLGLANPLKIDSGWLRADMRAVSKLVVDELPEDTTVGIHGTSLHAIRAMLNKGVLPAGAVKGDFTEGNIYFEPRLQALRNFSARIPPASLDEIQEAPGEYQGYSRSITGIYAKKHAILYILGLDFTEKQNHNLVIDIITGKDQEKIDATAALVAKGVGSDSLKIALHLAQDFHGVLIGLKPNVLNDFPLLPNPNKSEAPRIIVPNGLEDRYFSGIVPLGDTEREFFKRLKRQ